MAAKHINIFVSSFPGLGLPSTLCLPLPATSSISDLFENLGERLPSLNRPISVSTLTNRQLISQTSQKITSLLDTPNDAFLHIRLSACLCGGKGGFGSQLRAAGGRMSSRKKRKQGEEHASSRNLDGRRLRTVTEAKALAEYLAVKPEMDKKEKEERRKRWEQVIELAERKEHEAKYGNRARLDGKWVEAKEDATEKTREAVLASIKCGEINALLSQPESDQSVASSEDATGSESGVEAESSLSAGESANCVPRVFHGWDEDDDAVSDDDDSIVDRGENVENCDEFENKGKGRNSVF